MDRNYEFEIQYLISLTVAVIAFVTSRGLSGYTHHYMGYLFLGAVSLHLIIFQFVYTASTMTAFEVNIAQKSGKIANYTLLLITVIFMALVLHSSIGFFLGFAPECGSFPKSIRGITITAETCNLSKSLLWYVFPFITTAIIIAGTKKTIMPALESLRDVEVTVAPPEVRVFNNYSDTEPLFVKISNKSPEELQFTINIRTPDGLRWKEGTNEGRGRYSDEVTLAPNRRETVDLKMKYEGRDNRTDFIDVAIRHEDDVFEDPVRVFLDST